MYAFIYAKWADMREGNWKNCYICADPSGWKRVKNARPHYPSIPFSFHFLFTLSVWNCLPLCRGKSNPDSVLQKKYWSLSFFGISWKGQQVESTKKKQHSAFYFARSMCLISLLHLESNVMQVQRENFHFVVAHGSLSRIVAQDKTITHRQSAPSNNFLPWVAGRQVLEKREIRLSVPWTLFNQQHVKVSLYGDQLCPSVSLRFGPTGHLLPFLCGHAIPFFFLVRYKK